MDLGAERRQYMAKQLFDWGKLDSVVNPKPVNRLDYNTHKHLFKKVAFDAYKPLEGSADQLWELREENDGTYLYALYDGDSNDLVAKSNDEDSEWKATADLTGKNVTLSYKKIPVYRFASDKYSFPPERATEFAKFVESKAKDQNWVQELANNEMSTERRAAVLKLIQGE
jgi:hypothetical protein